jgi:hypothetical protein
MIPTRVVRYRDPAAVAIGLGELRRQGLTPRGILFVALDPRGETHIAIPEDMNAVTEIKIGDKLALHAPWEGRFFHFDSIHRLPTGGVLWNGDRRLAQTGSASEVAVAIAEFCKGSGAKNVVLGCTPHQPGAWWTLNDRTSSIALHELGFVDVVTAPSGLIARRIGEVQLYYQPYTGIASDGLVKGWTGVFLSDLGNILMLERRILKYRLVLTCERGLIEVDVATLPFVHEALKVPLASGFGVVGRIDGGAFAVTNGVVEPWGLADVQPALLVGSPNETLADLARALAKKSAAPAS